MAEGLAKLLMHHGMPGGNSALQVAVLTTPILPNYPLSLSTLSPLPFSLLSPLLRLSLVCSYPLLSFPFSPLPRQGVNEDPTLRRHDVQDGDAVRILVSLLLLHFSPGTEDLSRARQCLAVALDAYSRLHPGSQLLLADAFLPAARQAVLLYPNQKKAAARNAAASLVRFMTQLLQAQAPGQQDQGQDQEEEEEDPADNGAFPASQPSHYLTPHCLHHPKKQCVTLFNPPDATIPLFTTAGGSLQGSGNGVTHEALAERILNELFSVPKTSGSKAYVAALCKASRQDPFPPPADGPLPDASFVF